jgi:hypothetical protein
MTGFLVACALCLAMVMAACGGGGKAIETQPEENWPDAAVWVDAAASDP